MPFVPSANAPSPELQGVPDNTPKAGDKPAFWSETIPAAIRQENVLGAGFVEEKGQAQTDEYGQRIVDPDFNPFSQDNIAGYEEHADSFAQAMTASESDAIKRQIDRERIDRETIAQSGAGGFVAAIAAGTLDPTIFIPVGGAAKKGESLLRVTTRYGLGTGAGAGVSEALLHGTQETRTAQESTIAVSGAVLLGGLLGGGGTAAYRKLNGEDAYTGLAKRVEDDFTVKEADIDELPPVEGQTVSEGSIGAAAVNKPVTSAEDEAIAGTLGVAEAMTKTLNLNPELRTSFSPSARVRETKNRLISSGLKLERNKKGVRSYTAIEDIVETYKGDVQQAYSVMDAQYVASRAEAGKDTGAVGAVKRFINPRSPLQFREEVAKAMRRGDTHSDPHVEASAKALRPLYDKLRKEAIEVGILPENVGVRTADSYLHRMWNQREIVAREPEFKQRLADHVRGQIERRLKVYDEFQGIEKPRIGDFVTFDPARAQDGDLNRLINQVRNPPKPGGESRPTFNLLRGMGGVEPNSELAGELANIGITARTMPGLFKRGGIKSADNVVVSEHPFLRDNVEPMLNGYADPEDILRAIGDEKAGFPWRDLDETERVDALFGPIDDITSVIDELGLDLSKMGNAEVEARINDHLNQSEVTGEGTEIVTPKKGDSFLEYAADDGLDAKYIFQDGEHVANVLLKVEGDELFIDNITSNLIGKDAFNTLGPSIIRSALREMGKLYPGTKIVKGNRVGGARFGGDFTGDRGLGVPAEIKINRNTSFKPSDFVDDAGQPIGRTTKSAQYRDALKKAQGQREALLRRLGFSDMEARTFERNSRELEDIFSIEGDDYVDDIVQGVVDKLRGLDQRELPGNFVVAERGPLKNRTLNVKDIDFEDFLVNDVEVVTNRYTRLAATDIALTREFGDPAMEKAMRDIREEYLELAANAKDRKARDKLAKQLKNDIRDIEGMRDIVRGNYSKHDPDSLWVRAGETAKQWNFTRLLGGMTVSAFPDTARHVMSHGLGNIATELVGPMMKNLNAVKLQVDEARLAGAVTEKILNTRISTLAEINNPSGRGTAFQNFMDNLVAGFSRATLMTQWNDMQKAATSVITQNRIAKGIKAGDKISVKEREFLAFIGLDETNLPAIEKQMKRFGRIVDGVQIANVADWTDSIAARQYRAALVKDAKSTIVTRGAGDVPLAANTPTGQVVFQFKTFVLAANQRVMLRGLQDRDAAALTGLITMIGMGMMVYYFKSVSAGRETSDDPRKWVMEGIDRSGVIPVMMEVNNIYEKTGAPGLSYLAGGEQASRYQSRGVTGAFLGPSVDLVDQTFRATRGVFDEGWKDTDIGTIRKLVPYNNLFYMRWLFDELELVAGDALGAEEGRRTDQLEN